MDRFARFTFIALLCCGGCGTSTETTSEAPAQPSTQATVAAVTSSPTDVVSQFLDQIRRGGQDSPANQMLTQKAQSELKRIGRTVEPIGSPDARFQVTRAEMVPDEANSALVHSIWSEPDEDGTTSDFQVVCAVEQEAGAWRISGLAMEVDPNESPVIIDFENGELMAQILANPDLQDSGAPAPSGTGQPNSGGAPSQAAATDPVLSR